MPVWIRGVLFQHTSVHYQPVSYQLPGPIRQAIESLLHPHPASSAESPCIQQTHVIQTAWVGICMSFPRGNWMFLSVPVS